MQLQIKFNGHTQSIAVDHSLTLADLKMLCCMEVTGADSPEYYLEYLSQKLPVDNTSLLQHNIPDNATLTLKKINRKRLQNSQGAPSTSKTTDFILNAALKGLRSSNDGSVPVIPQLDFSGIKVENISTGSTPTSIKLSAAEISQYRLMFMTMRSNPDLKAQLSQSWPGAMDSLEANKIDDFLEYFRKVKQSEHDMKKQMFAAIANPDTPETKKYLSDLQKKEDIQQNLSYTMEYHPEAFGRVFMLYIKCKINGVEVTAFIDSGAQFSIMNLTTAKRCKIDNLIDERFQGIAQGVGTRKILGQIHSTQLQIETGYFASTFHIMDEETMPILIGLEFLKRHQASIDLAQNALIMPNSGIKAPFLGESEIPQMERQITDAALEAHRKMSQEEKISQLIQMGYLRDQAVEALRKSNGDLEGAVSFLT